jgi:hypothetical protein
MMLSFDRTCLTVIASDEFQLPMRDAARRWKPKSPRDKTMRKRLRLFAFAWQAEAIVWRRPVSAAIPMNR